MTYRSKIGSLVWVVLIGLICGLSIFYIINHIWAALVINLLVTSFITHMILTTYYTIKDDVLNVHCGFFYNTDIEIAKIRSITETNSVLSAPALSMDRIEIFYNTYDSIVISPQDKNEFIKHLKSLNNNIQISPFEKKISK